MNDSNTSDATSLQSWLEAFLTESGGIAGSVHCRQGEQLVLAAQVHLPPPVVEKTRTIPKGRGMAGLAWERNRSVSTCNLQTDETGDVRPGAKAVAAAAALAIPVHDAEGSVRAVVGIAFADQRDLSPDEQKVLENAAENLPATPAG